MTIIEYIFLVSNIGLAFVAGVALRLACRRKIGDDLELKIKTLEDHIETLHCIIAALIDLREDVQRTRQLAQAIAEAVAKPKTGLAPTPVTLTPPRDPRKAARAAEANRVAEVHRKGGRP